MNELSRLIAAEKAEAPPAHLTERGLEALNAALDAGAPSLAVAHGPLKLGLSLAGKSMLGSGLLAFVVTTGGLTLHAVTTSEPGVPPRAGSLAPPQRTRTLAPSASHSRGAPQTEPDARAAGADVASSPPSIERRSMPERGSTFSDELRLIKAAKLELDAGRGHLARAWLDEHARRYPNGIFQRERETLVGRVGGGGRASFENDRPAK